MSKVNQSTTNVEREYGMEGQLTLETTYHDEKKHGIEKEYRCGSLYKTTPYRLGIRFGVETVYSRKGIPRQETRYINGIQESIKIYDANGVVLSEETFSLGDREVEIKNLGGRKHETFYINGEEVSFNAYDSDNRIVYSTYSLPNRGVALKIVYDKKNYQISSQEISGEGNAPEICLEYWGTDFLESTRAHNQKKDIRLIRNYRSGYIVRETGFSGSMKQGLEKIYGRESVLISETMNRRGSHNGLRKTYTRGVLSHLSAHGSLIAAEQAELKKLLGERPHRLNLIGIPARIQVSFLPLSISPSDF